MPRRLTSRSPLAAENDSQPQLQHDSDNSKNNINDTIEAVSHTDKKKQMSFSSAAQPVSDLLGGNPVFADKFFGEPSNMSRNLPDGEAEADLEADQPLPHGGASHNGGASLNGTQSNGTSLVPQHLGIGNITMENTPFSIDNLIINQLQEDLEAYRYDYGFCRAQLENPTIDSTPAEQRTFQLRILDIGHQMRMLNHRIQLMQASIMSNSRQFGGLAGRVGASTANAYYGAYPPGTSIQPNAYANGASMMPNGGMAAPGTPQYNNINHYQSAVGGSSYMGYPEAPQERRGPGRPQGSRNRPRPVGDPSQVLPSAASGANKAAALASAGAKRNFAAADDTEIRVATPNGQSASSGSAGSSAPRSASREKPSKRPRLDVQVGSPLSNSTDGDKLNVPNNGSTTGLDTANSYMDDATEDETDHANAAASTFTVNKKGKTTNPFVPSTPLPSQPSASADNSFAGSSDGAGPAGPDSAPRGSNYTRLGHWMCTLCTSQKYLQAPPPKQPSEPSNWPLRDISKIVTHFTRMHAEHNNIERCMELGAALDANRGPFKYWIENTKKTKIADGALNAAIDSLNSGFLPDLLRKLSISAKEFPRQD